MRACKIVGGWSSLGYVAGPQTGRGRAKGGAVGEAGDGAAAARRGDGNQPPTILHAPVGMLALGMGNGAVFQLVPQRFRMEIGVMTGLIGMTGGIGGFYLASSLGYSKQLTGSYSAGLLVFAALAAVALLGLTSVKTRWRTTWGAVAGLGRV